MIVKAYKGDGEWQLWQADFELQFLGGNTEIWVAEHDHDYWVDERFPTDDVDMLLHVNDPNGLRAPAKNGDLSEPGVFVRWVKWYTSPQTFMLVTNGPIYILNDEGRTIEALH